MDWLEQFLLFLVALVANAFSAFAGGWAGLLQFPALIFLGLPFGVALATHKVATVALGFGATLRHLRERTLERRMTVFILAAGLPGVVAGAAFILDVPDRPAQTALGLLTMGLGIYSFSNRRLGLGHTPIHRSRPRLHPRRAGSPGPARARSADHGARHLLFFQPAPRPGTHAHSSDPPRLCAGRARAFCHRPAQRLALLRHRAVLHALARALVWSRL